MTEDEPLLGELRDRIDDGALISDVSLVDGEYKFVVPALEAKYEVIIPDGPHVKEFVGSPEYNDALMVPETLGVALLDLVGFSLHPDDVQLKIIVRYQCEVRKALHGRSVRATISIGDGTVFVFEEAAIPQMPECLFEIDHALAGFNLDFKWDGIPEMSWRVGVHVGQAFLFRDINRQENFVGSALNIARRVSDCVPEPGQQDSFETDSTIYVSEDAHETFKASGLPEGIQFTDVGVCTVKHGEKIRVFAMHKVTKA